MVNFAIRRFIGLLIVAWGISTIVFFLLRLTGDPTILFLSPESPPEQLQRLREEMGFDKPLLVQYFNFLGDILHGDFGDSIRHRREAFPLVLERLPATLELATAGILIAVVVGIPLGIVAALKRGTLVEAGAMVTALIGQSVPNFWLALMMIIIFGVHLQWLPVSGRGEPAQLIMPALAVAVFPMARIARLVRSGLLEQIQQDYVRTARAKGLKSLATHLRHALPNAAIPTVTLIGLDFGRLLGGAVIVEMVFAWPGAGLLAVRAVTERDFPLVQASVFVLGLIFILIHSFIDLLYIYIDPRIKFD